ncbi:MAG: patatin-like phospholipase family protein [Bacteroidetes bacterium]|nr:patatin-like phospholipase family protein [Bacteroidota bacterium]
MQQVLGWAKAIWNALISADSYRNLAKAAWLFFPAMLFLTLTYVSFWHITQGKDIVLFTLQKEKANAFAFVILTQCFWAYMVWYSSRLVAKAKFWEQPHYFLLNVRVHLPRILGFCCFTVMELALLQVPFFKHTLSPQTATVLLVLAIPFYLLTDRFWHYLIVRRGAPAELLMSAAAVLLLAGAIGVVLLKSAAGLVALFIAMQIAFVLFMIGRRKVIEKEMPDVYALQEQPYDYKDATGIWLLAKKMQRLFLDREDRWYFVTFNIIGLGVTIIYICALHSVRFSVYLGTIPILLTAFGVLAGFVNLVATLSVFARFNFHIILVILAFLIGSGKEQYNVSLPAKKINDSLHSFANRQLLTEYITHWLAQRDTGTGIGRRSSNGKYPIYIVMSNGGASRSGYWAASVMGYLQDKSGADFSDHLFCMSGASGGSVGNATFFSLLMNKSKVPLKGDSSFRAAAQDYLKSDFLSHTLAYMLGPDFFQHVVPFVKWENREDALVASMEKAPDDSAFLRKKLDTTFSSMMALKGDARYPLPILFINTTRMQDGRPSVVSNIMVDDNTFNKRVDVLGLLSDSQDMKLSTGVVLGASFPYLSPAGRIDHYYPLEKRNRPHYFVDGGYFDNSGAGVVNEMLIAIKKMLSETGNPLSRYRDSIEFYVLHITNDPIGNPRLDTTNALVNDLGAPIKTLFGADGTQTAVNDLRLKKYMQDWYNDDLHYREFNLYQLYDFPNKYSMNWVISPPLLSAMRERLRKQDIVNELNTVLQRMK